MESADYTGWFIVHTIRVALLAMKPRLRDMLTTVLEHEPDLEVIHGLTPSGGDLATARPDVVVGEAADPRDAELPDRLLRAVPLARVLLVAEGGDHAVQYELRPVRTVLADVSIDQLIGAIRQGPDRSVVDHTRTPPNR